MYKKILYPVDIDDVFVKTLRYAFNIAAHYHAELILLHASFDLLDDREETMLRIPLEKFHKQENEAIQRATNVLNEALSVIGIEKSSDFKYSFSIIEAHDHAGKSIVQYASENHIDLIVMPRPFHSVAFEIIHGSVGSYIVHHAECPVLLIPEEK